MKTVLAAYQDYFRERFMDGLSIRKYAEAHQLNRGSVDYQQKKFFSALACLLKERDEAEGNMPAAETSTKVNNPTSNGASATKQTLCFSVKCMSVGYIFPNTSRETTWTPSKSYVKPMSYANVLG